MSDVRESTSVEAGDVQRTFHPIALEHVGGRYFQTLAVPIVRGRTFTEHDFAGGGAEDVRESETPVVINQTAEQRIFGAGSAVGSRLWADDDGRSYVVIGVVPDIRPGLLNMTPNTPVATAFAPIPVARFGSASIQGTTGAGPGHVRTQPDGRRPRRVEADSPAADHPRRSHDGRIPRAIRAHGSEALERGEHGGDVAVGETADAGEGALLAETAWRCWILPPFNMARCAPCFDSLQFTP